MKPEPRTSNKRTIKATALAGLAAGALVAAWSAWAAPAKTTPPGPDEARWREECGACHIAYPARMLDAPSWSAVMSGLRKHFGTDASLEAETAAAIGAYLQAHARKRPTVGGDGRPLRRITDSGWFRREHRGHGIEAARASGRVKSLSACEACHAHAAAGRFGEHDIHVPAENAK
ncbi:MAG: cytochrome C [Gammaproteobacteria bacterium]